MKILMVCLGNICRSPLAEGILRNRALQAGLDWDIDSAGTNGYHVGEVPHKLSQKVARLNGIDIGNQSARKFTAADLQHFDKIYAMAGDVIDDMRRIAEKSLGRKTLDILMKEKVGLIMNELEPFNDIDVPDPYYGGESGYHDVFQMIDAAAQKIVEKYKKS